MTGRELHEALLAAGVYENVRAPEPMPVVYEGLPHHRRDALERAAASLTPLTHPAAVTSPVGPPTVSGTSVTKDVGRGGR